MILSFFEIGFYVMILVNYNVHSKNIIKMNKNKDQHEKLIGRSRDQKYFSSMDSFYRYGCMLN
jgi:hypothetical protein